LYARFLAPFCRSANVRSPPVTVEDGLPREFPPWVISSGSFVDSEVRYLQDCGLPKKDDSAPIPGIAGLDDVLLESARCGLAT
jgi:hypothetical protein